MASWRVRVYAVLSTPPCATAHQIAFEPGSFELGFERADQSTTMTVSNSGTWTLGIAIQNTGTGHDAPQAAASQTEVALRSRRTKSLPHTAIFRYSTRRMRRSDSAEIESQSRFDPRLSP